MRNNRQASSAVKITMATRVVILAAEQINDEEEQYKKTFRWSCLPLLNWFNILGIPLQIEDTKSSASNARYYCKLSIACFGFFMFLTNLARLFVYITFDFFAVYSSSTNMTDSVVYRKTSSTTIWNDFLDYFNEFFISLGSQLILITSTLVHWKDLTAVLNRIEDQNIFSLKTFRQFRRIFVFGISIVILVFLKN